MRMVIDINAKDEMRDAAIYYEIPLQMKLPIIGLKHSTSHVIKDR